MYFKRIRINNRLIDATSVTIIFPVRQLAFEVRLTQCSLSLAVHF